jgi:hypothetical protein
MSHASQMLRERLLTSVVGPVGEHSGCGVEREVNRWW